MNLWRAPCMRVCLPPALWLLLGLFGIQFELCCGSMVQLFHLSSGMAVWKSMDGLVFCFHKCLSFCFHLKQTDFWTHLPAKWKTHIWSLKSFVRYLHNVLHSPDVLAYLWVAYGFVLSLSQCQIQTTFGCVLIHLVWIMVDISPAAAMLTTWK